MTIVQATIKVLEKHPEGLPVQDIYNAIIDKELYNFKAKFPVQVLLGTIRRQCFGLDFPSAYPIKYFKYTEKDGTILYSIYKSSEAQSPTFSRDKFTVKNDSLTNDFLPEELVIRAYRKHVESVKKQLLDAILDNEKGKYERAAFFEKLVVDLIIRLGYGYDSSAGTVTGRSHDGGIDGIIYEDRLGLDKIYIQAKCYGVNQSVGSKDVQAFVGAMRNIQKGVFVTTAHFSKEAKKYILEQQLKSIKLIDGNDLAELMVKCTLGLTEIERLPIYKIDNDYFNV